MNILSIKKQNDLYSSARKAGHKIREAGQLRHAKMHASCLTEALNDKNVLTPALRELLEASIILQTTSTKILAAYLQRSPATIRAGFQRIRTIFWNQDRQAVKQQNKKRLIY